MPRGLSLARLPLLGEVSARVECCNMYSRPLRQTSSCPLTLRRFAAFDDLHRRCRSLVGAPMHHHAPKKERRHGLPRRHRNMRAWLKRSLLSRLGVIKRSQPYAQDSVELLALLWRQRLHQLVLIGDMLGDHLIDQRPSL